ncbi:ACTR10 isoform 8 [Pongo abelii]|uniref:ACTR10 isoform 8 n=1 Tax=Pongo abelii TaxID=9601 RepID=A0A2J8WL86_PONAB|nr:ACTR10 isoform 8 [Pongo abelii]
MPLYEGLGSGGEKTAVVIDLGEAFTKCGFAGETGPRCIIPSVIKRAGMPKPIRVVQYNINTEELYSYLKEFIHILYFRELETQLLEQCTVDTSAAKEQSLPSVMGSVPEGVLEDIKVRTCFVSDLKRGLKIQAAKFNIDGNNERPSPPPNVDYPLDGEKILHVLGSIRDSVVEILFEQDNEEQSVATLILDSLIQCPIDTRKQLAENLVVIGGTSMLPGFLHRLLAEIRYLVEKPKYKKALGTKTFRIHTPPAKANCVAWLGGAIFGALQDILGSRSVSKEYYNQTGRIPDWCSLNNPPLEMMFDVGKTQPPLMKRAFSTEK